LARQAGVGIETLAVHCGEPDPHPGLVIGYGAIPAERIEEGMRRLRATFQDVVSRT
jgi:GntR family transcriptional regulator/MocR family aminotransferase